MANQLRKLKRRQLLELLVAQGKELEAKQAELQAARKQIAGLENRLIKLGAGVRTAPRTEENREPEQEKSPAEAEESKRADGREPSGRADS